MRRQRGWWRLGLSAAGAPLTALPSEVCGLPAAGLARAIGSSFIKHFGPRLTAAGQLGPPGPEKCPPNALAQRPAQKGLCHSWKDRPRGNTVAPIEIHGELPPAVLARVRALPQVRWAFGAKLDRMAQILLPGANAPQLPALAASWQAVLTQFLGQARGSEI
jgi:hypothetical protein